MARFRPYYVSSGVVAISGTSPVPVLYGIAASGFDYNACAIRLDVLANSGSPVIPANASLQVQLCQTTGTVGGGATVTAQNTGQGSVSSKSVWTSASSAALTGLTQGAEQWPGTCPLAPGVFCGELFADGFEIHSLFAGPLCVYVTPSASATGLAVVAGVSFSE